MKSTFQFLGLSFVVSAKLIEQGVSFPFEKNGNPYHNKFRVHVSTTHGKISFLFFGSEHNYRNGTTEMSESDLRHALYCLFSDSCSGSESFEYFCSEPGYDEDSRTAERIYKACKRQAEKTEKIIGDLSIYDLVNEMNE